MSRVDEIDGLIGARKVAALLMALGSDTSSRLLARLAPDDVHRVVAALSTMTAMSIEVRDAVVEDAYAGLAFLAGEMTGGEPFTRSLLVSAFGEEKATAMMERISAGRQTAPFAFLERMDPAQIGEILTSEHPQAIAVVLSYLEPRRAASILQTLEPPLYIDVARRIAAAETVAPGAITIVEDGLRRRAEVSVSELRTSGGVVPLAHILNNIERSAERNILNGLVERDPDLAEEVRKRMFTFEDIVWIDARGMEQLLRTIPPDVVALALRGATATIKQKFLAGLSQRAGEDLELRMETTARVRLRQVEEAQQKILEEIKRLAEDDKLIIDRGDREDLFI